MKNPAREKFGPLLSPYVDGELSVEERREVEQHLQLNKQSAAQVDDFRAADALMRHALDMQADDVDFATMTENIMSRLTPERPPLFERLRLTVSELFLYQRGTFVAATAGAAIALLVSVPLALRFGSHAPDGYANERVEVQTVTIDDSATVRPVVMETEQGDAIIWTVEQTAPDGDGGEKKKKKKRDEEGEEEVLSPPAKEGPL